MSGEPERERCAASAGREHRGEDQEEQGEKQDPQPQPQPPLPPLGKPLAPFQAEVNTLRGIDLLELRDGRKVRLFGVTVPTPILCEPARIEDASLILCFSRLEMYYSKSSTVTRPAEPLPATPARSAACKPSSSMRAFKRGDR